MSSPSKPVRQRLFSIKETAVYLGRTENAVRKICYHGGIPIVKFDRRVFVDVKDLDIFIEKRKERLVL